MFLFHQKQAIFQNRPNDRTSQRVVPTVACSSSFFFCTSCCISSSSWRLGVTSWTLYLYIPFRGDRSSKKCCLELGGLFQRIYIYISIHIIYEFASLQNHKVQEYHTRSWHGKLEWICCHLQTIANLTDHVITHINLYLGDSTSKPIQDGGLHIFSFQGAKSTIPGKGWQRVNLPLNLAEYIRRALNKS